MSKSYYIYMMSNQKNTVLYTGVTNDLVRRVYEHKIGEGSLFVKKYNVTKCVYFEEWSDIRDAIAREKQIKGGSRRKKNDLVNSMNPTWHDMSTDFE